MAQELEPNNTRSSSDTLTEGVWMYGSVGTSSDIDSFKISLSSPSLVKIHFDSPQENTGRYSSDGTWKIQIVNYNGETIAANLMDFDGEFDFALNAGTYYVLIEDVPGLYLNGTYGIKYTKTTGSYYSSYENDGSSSLANNMIEDQYYTGNLYGTQDRDYFKIDLGNSNSEITVTFDSAQNEGYYINPAGTENSFRTIYEWQVALIDSSGNTLGGKVFKYDGSFTLNTKSSGEAYIIVYQTDVGYFAPTKYAVKYNKKNITTNEVIGTDGDDPNLKGTSNDDTITVTTGNDKIDAGLGTDVLVVPSDADFIIRSIDKFGSYTGIVDQKFIYVQLKDENKFTTAFNFEEIRLSNSSEKIPINEFSSRGKWLVTNNDIPTQTINTANSKKIDLNNYIYSLNETSLIVYAVEVDKSELRDQVILDSIDILKLTGGSSGDVIEANVKITATQVNPSATVEQNFKIFMRDDDYKNDSPVFNYENEPNDLYDMADPLDPNFNSDPSNNYTSSSFDKNNVTKGNLATIGDFDRYWINLDKGETVKFKFKPPINSSFKIYVVNESTGDVINFTTVERSNSSGTNSIKVNSIIGDNSISNDDIFIIANAPSERVHHILITGNKNAGTFSSNDYEISIDSFPIATTKVSSSVLDTNDADTVGEKITGTSASETLNGTTLGEIIEGLGGDDIIYSNGGRGGLKGGEGNDTLYGGKGADDFYVSEGIDIAYGEEGIDILTIPDKSYDVGLVVDTDGIYFDKGTEYIYVKSSNGNSIMRASGIERIDLFDSISATWTNGSRNNSSFSIDDFNFSIFEDDNYSKDNLSTSEAPSDTNYQLSSLKNENGPILSEYSTVANNSGTLNHKSSNEFIVLTGQANILRGLGGDDTYFISDLVTSGSKINITDTDGDNIIQIPDNTKITKVLFVSNAARIWLENNQEITINSADKFVYSLSGNSAGGDEGYLFTFTEFVELFNVSIGSGEQQVNLYTKSDAKSLSSYVVIDISALADKIIYATNDKEEFRYEVDNNGISKEGPHIITINGFDKSNDKISLVITDGTSKLTTKEFDNLSGVEVTSDGLSGTQIYFSPDSNGLSGTLVISDLDEPFSGSWEATTYDVEIIPKSNLLATSSSSNESFSFSENIDNNKVILEPYNDSTFNGTANFNEFSEIIVITGQATSLRGLAGDDTYIISNLIPKDSKISIVDTNGNNVIQIPDNTYIDATTFTKNAARLTLEDGRQITINSADKFIYNLGSNITTGDSGEDLTFSEFAGAFGIDDVLNLSGAEKGIIYDQYLI